VVEGEPLTRIENKFEEVKLIIHSIYSPSETKGRENMENVLATNFLEGLRKV